MTTLHLRPLTLDELRRGASLRLPMAVLHPLAVEPICTRLGIDLPKLEAMRFRTDPALPSLGSALFRAGVKWPHQQVGWPFIACLPLPDVSFRKRWHELSHLYEQLEASVSALSKGPSDAFDTAAERLERQVDAIFSLHPRESSSGVGARERACTSLSDILRVHAPGLDPIAAFTSAAPLHYQLPAGAELDLLVNTLHALGLAATVSTEGERSKPVASDASTDTFAAAPPPGDAVAAAVERVVEHKVREGYLAPADAASWCADLLLNTGVPEVLAYLDGAGEEGFADAQRQLRSLVDAAVERAVQRNTALGDSATVERLEGAFAELEASGIIARPALGETLQDCAWRIHHEALPKARASGIEPRGFVTFYQQALEAAIDDGELDLAYGAPSGETEASLAVAREVLEALRRHGLDATWSGRRSDGIRVCVTDWRRVFRSSASRSG